MLGKIYLSLLCFIRSSKKITYLIWGLKISNYCHSTFWDLTTLVIKKELGFSNKINYLDMGCGQFAILGQYYKKNRPNSVVVSVDLYKDFVNNSLENSKNNKNTIEIFQSDLFENVHNKFDLISFNPPYVPNTSKKENDKDQYSKIRYSGIEGTEIMSIFLENAKKFLSNKGIILLGINNFYVSEESCLKIIDSYGYKVKKITKMSFNTSAVFVLE